MKSIDVEFVPGERVLVKPKGIAAKPREGVIQRVAAYYGGCRSYRVRCQDDQGAIYSVPLNADEIAPIEGTEARRDKVGERGTEARRDEGTEGEEGGDCTIAWCAKLPGPESEETTTAPMRMGTVAMLCIAFLLCLAGIAVAFSSAGCAAVQAIDEATKARSDEATKVAEPTTTRPTVDVTENPKGVESHSKTEQTGVINNSAAGNTGFAFSTTVGAGIVAIFVAMILAFFGFLILQEVLSHKRAMARDALAIGGAK